MDNIEFFDKVKRVLKYYGRAMAFRDNGEDYGIVTIMISSHYIATPSLLFYEEKTGKLIGTDGLRRQNTSRPMSAAGKIYSYCIETDNGERIYVGAINK